MLHVEASLGFTLTTLSCKPQPTHLDCYLQYKGNLATPDGTCRLREREERDVNISQKRRMGFASQQQLSPRRERVRVLLWGRCNLAWMSVTLPNLGFAQVTYPWAQWFPSTTKKSMGISTEKLNTNFNHNFKPPLRLQLQLGFLVNWSLAQISPSLFTILTTLKINADLLLIIILNRSVYRVQGTPKDRFELMVLMQKLALKTMHWIPRYWPKIQRFGLVT